MHPSRSISSPRQKSSIQSPKPDVEEGTHRRSALVPVPSDGGYGWVIVFISFLGYLTVDGIAYSFYIFREGLINEGFNEDQCAILSSVFNALAMLLGPVSSSMCNLMGFRIIMLFGSIIATIGFSCCFVSKNFMTFFLNYSIIGGVGVGIMYLPMSIPTGLWFDATRPLAIGMSSCGTGVGMIIIPFLCELIKTYYSWRMTVFLMAGMMSINIITSLLLKPVPLIMIDLKDGSIAVRGATNNDVIIEYPVAKREEQTPSITGIRGKRRSYRMSVTALKQRELKKRRFLEGPSFIVMSKDTCWRRCWKCGSLCGNFWSPPKGHRPMEKTDVFYYGSIFRFDKSKHIPVESALMYSMHTSRMHFKSDEKSACCPCCPESFTRSLQNMCNCVLLKSPSFYLYSVASIFFYTVITVPILYLYTFVKKGFSSTPYLNFIIPSMGIGVLVGRLGGGGLLQLVPTISALAMCSILGIIIAITTALLPLNPIYYLIFPYAVLYGMSFGLYGALRSLILVDYVGLDNLTSATGILFALAGICNMIGPPLTVHLTDQGENMKIAFYFSGAFFTASTISLLPLYCIKKWQN